MFEQDIQEYIQAHLGRRYAQRKDDDEGTTHPIPYKHTQSGLHYTETSTPGKEGRSAVSHWLETQGAFNYIKSRSRTAQFHKIPELG